MNKTKRGLFIVLEGIDNCGKTTQSKLLKQYFQNEGFKVIQTREPGGTEVGEEIRLVLIKNRKNLMNPLAQTLLFYAARKEFIENIVKQNLMKGINVITDRFEASTYVYQGIVQRVSKEFIDLMHHWIVTRSDCIPDMYIILDISAQESFRRNKNIDNKGQQFIYEKQGLKFMEKLRRGYKKYARENKNTVLINGILDIQTIHQKIIQQVKILVNKSK